MNKGDLVRLKMDAAKEIGLSPTSIYEVEITKPMYDRLYLCLVEERDDNIRLWYPADQFEVVDQ